MGVNWTAAVIAVVVMGVVAAAAYGVSLQSAVGYTEQQAVEAAKLFLLNGPTFRFDGVADSVVVKKVTQLRSPYTWLVEIDFLSRHSGYGDRTGKIVLPVITAHTISIVVQKGQVTSATIDEVWDEIAQRPLFGATP